MNILIVSDYKIPVSAYGGVERMIWWLGKELARLGHKVTYLVKPGSVCPFADLLFIDHLKSIEQQVPDYIDVVHFQAPVTDFKLKPYISTVHINPAAGLKMDENTVFVSANHAARMSSDIYVHNCIDLSDYPIPGLRGKRVHTHFLAKAAWRVKNVKGAIDVATKSGNKLVVLGGSRLNIKMGFRFTPNLNVSFRGIVGNEVKSAVMNNSRALIFPVLWHEPFGIAIIESLYFGCPVFGTPYGSLPELVPGEYGLLSDSKSVLAEGLRNIGAYDNRLCHEYAADNFNSHQMTANYLALYEKVLNGKKLSAVRPVAPPAPQSKFMPWNE